VLRRLLPLLLVPGVFIATWLVGAEHERHQRFEARALAAQLAHAEERVHDRTGAYTDDVDRLVDEAHAHALARNHGIDAFAGPDVFEVTVYAKRYGGRDSYTVSRRRSSSAMISASPPRGASGHSSTPVHQNSRGVPG
jgi:hypothetical protein